MNGLWKKRITAMLMTLVMTVSLMPAALADDCADGQHVWDGGTITEASTCTKAGTMTYHCTVSGCSATRTEPIPLADHKYDVDSSQSTPATCQQAGKTVYVCSVCGDTKESEIAKTPHQWGAWVEKTPATCTAEGSESRSCDICSEEESRTIPKKEHTYLESGIKVTKEPSCKEAGTRTYTCSVCGTVGKTETIEKLPHTDSNNDGKCDVCGAAVSHTHVKGTLQNDATNHWYACSICGEKMETAAHYDSNKDAKCDLCGRAMGTSFTVRYFIPSISSSGIVSSGSSETVVSGSRPSKVPTPQSSFTINGTTYTFNRWSTVQGNPWYLYSSQSAVTPGNVVVTGNMDYYALYSTSANSTVITITAAPGKSTSFDVAKFRDAYRTRYSGENPSYVEFNVSRSNYEEFPGQVYSDSKALSRSDLINDSYNYSGSKGLSSLSFHADSSARNNSSLSITYVIYGADSSRSVTGTLVLQVSGSASDGDIEYEVAPGKYVNFKASDFRTLLRSEYGGASVDYVQFKQPSSSALDGGTLYYDYGGGSSQVTLTRSNLSNYKFYYNPGSRDYDLDDLTFAAGNNFKNKITLEFTVYGTGSNQSVTGSLVIKSTSSTTRGDIEYEVAPGKTVDLNRTDFREFLRDEEGSSAVVSYVQFSRPASTSVFANGTLYYDYGGGSGEVTLTRSNLSGYKFYYNPGRNDYDLDELTFAADRNFTDEITLNFTVYGTDSESAAGTLVIRSTAASTKLDNGDINYKVAPGQSVTVKISDFRSLLREEFDSRSDVSYVSFRRPSASSVFDDGTLYYDKGTSSEVTLTRSNLSGYKFYYTPGRNDYDLAKLSFTADNSFKDSITLDFTIYGEDADEYMDGTLVFYTDVDAAAASGYVGSIRYNTVSGTNVQIKAEDIARFLKQSLPGYTLQYVNLTGVPANGSLYYNYYGASSYGTSTRTQITSSNYSAQSYYFAPASTSQYALTELTYVPNSYNYCASIPFTAYAGSSLSVSGTILISVTQKTLSEVYGITPQSRAVNFPSSEIYNAVVNATGSGLYSIQLLRLPASTAGTIYVGSGTTTRAATNVQYTYASGANSISQLRFVPAGSYTGSVEIPYVALNSSGTALASGVFSLGVVNNVKSFTDMNASTWCYKYVAELSDANVIGGYTDGSFKPNSTLSYGAALKLIMLAAGYPEQAPTGKNVFSGYLDRARADGLVTRSNINLSAPITRLQVAQLAAGALKLSTSNLSTVKPFTDTSDLYVQALNAAGIVEGYFSNGTSTYRPNNSLTRGQISAIVWRMLNYRKGN